MSSPTKQRRGFRAMSPEKQREIARKGGLTVARNRKHMAEIGAIGGANSHRGDRSARPVKVKGTRKRYVRKLSRRTRKAA